MKTRRQNRNNRRAAEQDALETEWLQRRRSSPSSYRAQPDEDGDYFDVRKLMKNEYNDVVVSIMRMAFATRSPSLFKAMNEICRLGLGGHDWAERIPQLLKENDEPEGLYIDCALPFLAMGASEREAADRVAVTLGVPAASFSAASVKVRTVFRTKFDPRLCVLFTVPLAERRRDLRLTRAALEIGDGTELSLEQAKLVIDGMLKGALRPRPRR